MKSRVGRVDRGHKFGPGDFPDRTALAMRLARRAMSAAAARYVAACLRRQRQDGLVNYPPKNC